MDAPPGVTIRPTTPDDADALARLQVDSWEEAYSSLMPAAVFTERRATLDQRIGRWRQILLDAPDRTTVAELTTGSGGELLGFVSVGPARDDDVSVDEELWALYVRAAWWDRRLGHSLLTTVLGDRPAYLWVLRGNDRAIAFYRSHGFVEDGVTRSDEHGTELRMVRPPGLMP